MSGTTGVGELPDALAAKRKRQRAARAVAQAPPPPRALPLVLLPAVLALAVLPRSYDGFYDVKLLAAAILVAAAAGTAVWKRRAFARPFLTAPAVAAAAFVAVAAVATVTSDAPALSLFGGDEWHNGLSNYLVGLALFGLFATLMPARRLGDAAKALAAGGGAAVAYWLLQLIGIDPLGTTPPAGTFETDTALASTLGNPNYAGAFLAAALPGAVWAVTRARDTRRRTMWAGVTALLALGVWGAASLQAPLAAAAGLAVPGVAALADRSRRAAVAALAVGALLLLTAAAGLGQRGPLAPLGRYDTMVSRTWDWTAAVRMAKDEPLTGVGFARFGAYVRAYRPPNDILEFGWEADADAAHSVPLDLAAGGGLPLLAAYAAFVFAVGIRLVRGLLTLQGRPLALLGVFGGVWAAYQAQSLVSIDVAHLTLLHFLSAGAIVALTATGVTARPVRLTRPAGYALTGTSLLLIGALGAVTAAEYALGRSAYASNDGDRAAATSWVRAARFIAPWDPMNHAAEGLTLAWGTPSQPALDAYLAAVRRDPRNIEVLVAAIHTAESLGRHQLAWRLTRQLLTVEPQAAEAKVMAAESALALGQATEARALIDAALTFAPDNKEALALRRRLNRDRVNGTTSR